MYSIRSFTISLLVTLMMAITFSADAALKYQQDYTLISCKSAEYVKEEAEEFCEAAVGDPDIKIIGVKYKQIKKRKRNVAYCAIITCHVSEVDTDLMRISGKIFCKKHGLD